mgnify:CR=1 FL=1
MKPRIEEKLEVSRKDYPKAIAWLSNNGFTVLHPTRIVNSVYFDNHKLQMLFDAQEGITPRRKIRIRYYGSDQFTSTQSFALEVKESTALGRLKSIQSDLNISNTLSKGVYDKIYGLCFPVVKIKYKREYFKLNNWRITLDRDLTYENYGNPFFFKNKASDLAFVLEIKTSIDQDINLLRNFFDFPRSKFSKYERAFEHLNS